MRPYRIIHIKGTARNVANLSVSLGASGSTADRRKRQKKESEGNKERRNGGVTGRVRPHVCVVCVLPRQ